MEKVQCLCGFFFIKKNNFYVEKKLVSSKTLPIFSHPHLNRFKFIAVILCLRHFVQWEETGLPSSQLITDLPKQGQVRGRI